uniref:Uncharacterized protein n=1 Tax=Manihot esculenta TaxID=3983 RepID=A0A2C9UAH1_MANES
MIFVVIGVGKSQQIFHNPLKAFVSNLVRVIDKNKMLRL